MTVIAEEKRVDGTPASFGALLERLSRSSVTPGKHFDAYTDIDWDAPENAIDPGDARWELGDWDPLGATAWYKSQPQSVRAGIGLHFVADQMRTGLQFESVLKRGLLEFASMEPNRSPVFRYAYHEVIEEAQHSLMFQEFVNRSGVDPDGVPRALRPATREVIKFGRRFPPLFFVFVLGGEDPIDHVQRKAIRDGGHDVHPLLMRIMRIHVMEEARHLSFARHYLKLIVPQLGPLRRRILALAGPVILGAMAGLMMRPSRQLVRRYRIPRSVISEAYTRNPEARAEVRASLRKVRALLNDLDLITPSSRFLWRAFGIWDAPGTGAAPGSS